MDRLLSQNRAEFARFTEFGFLTGAGKGPGAMAGGPAPARFSRGSRIEGVRE